MSDKDPVSNETCEERREAQGKSIQIMFTQIQNDIREIKADIKDLKAGAASFVPWDAFREKCKEIEDLKRFSWKAAGIVSIIPTIIAIFGLVAKFTK